MTTPVYLDKIELVELAYLKTQGSTVASNNTSVILYYKLNKHFGFVDLSGAALSQNTSVTFVYYRKPLSDGTETIGEAIIPIIDDRWDDYLCYRACFEITGDPKWLAMSVEELRRTRSLQNAETDRGWQVPANTLYN